MYKLRYGGLEPRLSQPSLHYNHFILALTKAQSVIFVAKVKSAYKPSGPLGQSLSQFP